MKLVHFLLRESRQLVIFAVVAGLISGASITGIIALINHVLNTEQSVLTTLIWGFVALCATSLISEVVSQVLLLFLAQESVLKLRVRLSRQILTTPLRKLEEIGPHRLLAALTDDVFAISNAITMSPLLCLDITIIVSCLIYMGWLSWQLLLVMMGFLVLGVITYQIPIRSAGRFLRRARDEQDVLFSHLNALTEGTKELKMHRRRRVTFLNKALTVTAESLKRNRVTGMSIFRVSGAWGNLLFLLIIGLLLFVGPTLMAIDKATMTGYIMALLYTMMPVSTIANIASTFGAANVALRKIDQLGLSLTNDASTIDSLDRPDPAPRWERLELQGVTHTYYRERENTTFVLGPINLTLQPSELVFLVGGNGSGKTTLAKMLIGLYIPETGQICLDGRPVADENRDDYRQLFSVVFSDFYLFERLLGLEGIALDDQAQHYLHMLQLDHKVKVENGVLSTTALSQGQRKRLALLTAYLEDRPFYVFDEWAADQDPLFKDIFYTKLLPDLKQRGKTVLVISHDDKYYYLADRIVKLDNGQVDSDTRREASQLSAVL